MLCAARAGSSNTQIFKYSLEGYFYYHLNVVFDMIRKNLQHSLLFIAAFERTSTPGKVNQIEK